MLASLDLLYLAHLVPCGPVRFLATRRGAQAKISKGAGMFCFNYECFSCREGAV